MSEQQINNQVQVQGQNIAQYQQITQHFHGVGDKEASPTKPQRVWNIPYLRNAYFTGREEILTELYARFKANNATALSQRHAMSGLGGIGKTQIAVEYAYRYHEDYQAILWTRAESHEALTSSYVKIARLLDLPQKDEQDQTIIVQAVKRWLQDNGGWLLILDNADEPQIVREFLPTKFDGHILLTTRAQALGGLAQRIEVDTFTPELGALFLLRRATIIDANGALEQAIAQDYEVTIEISKELGGLLLALDQAGAYIEETGCGFSTYLELYRTRRATMLSRRGNSLDYPDSVATTWSLSFDKVEQRFPEAGDLLRFSAFLAPDAIPEEIITEGAAYLGPVLAPIASNPFLLNDALAALRAYSLIGRYTQTHTITVHRLVQAVVRDNLPIETQQQWMQRVVRALNTAFPHDTIKFQDWSTCDRLLPHALVCVSWIEQISEISLAAARLLNEAACYLDIRARHTESEPLYRRALSIREQQLGPQHPETATSLNNLGDLYRTQGRYAEAESFGKIYRNNGATTPGSTSETVDAMSLRKIDSIIDAVRKERYRWTPTRRVYIEKKNSTKKRPLSMPTWSDKLLQEVIRLILESYYEPTMSPASHGFRPGRGCHTALQEIDRT